MRAKFLKVQIVGVNPNGIKRFPKSSLDRAFAVSQRVQHGWRSHRTEDFLLAGLLTLPIVRHWRACHTRSGQREIIAFVKSLGLDCLQVLDVRLGLANFAARPSAEL